jgi:Tfp pilus assembly major pilin PilA
MNQHRINEEGFTILELLIATAVFSSILLLCAIAIVQVGRTFYKGATVNKVQDTTRLVTEDIVQAIQFGTTGSGFRRTAGVVGGVQSLCLGEIRYTYITTSALGVGGYQHILWKDRVASNDLCNGVFPAAATPNLTAAVPSASGKELLGDTMRIPVLNVPAPIGEIWTVTVTAAYGQDNVFTDNSFTKCIADRLGGQFCAVSSINTNVAKRL